MGEFGNLTETYRIKLPSSQCKKVASNKQQFPKLWDTVEHIKLAEFRMEEFNRTWSNQEKIIEQVIEDHHGDVIVSILDFIENSQNKNERIAEVSQIQTAVVIGGSIWDLNLRSLGYNSSDQDSFYTQLKANFQSHVRFAQLQAPDSVNAKDCLKKVIQQLIPEEDMAMNSKRPQYDIDILQDWYDNKLAGPRPILLCMIPDFESFNFQSLQKLIQIFGERAERLPLKFLFGLSTTIESLHQSLAKKLISYLNTKCFFLHQSESCLNKIVEKVLIDGDRFLKLGFGPYTSLLDRYNLRDLSITSFVKGLQFSYMSHYFGNSLSVFTFPTISKAQLHENHFTLIRSLPSFQQYIETQTKSEMSDEGKSTIKDLLTKNNFLFDWINRQIATLYSYNRRYCVAFQLMDCFQRLFTLPKFHKPIRALYAIGLKENIALGEHFRTCTILFKNLSVNEVEAFIQKCIDSIKTLHGPFIQDDLNTFESVLDEITMFEKSRVLEDAIEITSPTNSEVQVDLERQLKRAKLDISHQRKSHVSSRIGLRLYENAQQQSPWFKLLLKATDVITNFFKSALVPYTTLPLHEIIYFTDSQRLIPKTFHPEPRGIIQTALNHSNTYLGCECCESNSLCSKFEDICILYRLYLECGRLINLSDWYEAFKCVLSPNTSKNMNEPELQ
ncbi:origin recognition complex subunit 3 N-terminus-domain-containing protein [Globomyces pollinis-pini]|nr:origin recognition complex subunit 3 N-terminus-domain-containing protein [Globomyces pollinis-pini]